MLTSCDPSCCFMQEDDQLVKGYKKWGNSWTKIAQMIGGRTDNAVSKHPVVRVACGSNAMA